MEKVGSWISEGSSDLNSLTCADLAVSKKIGGKFICKIHPSDSPRQSPDPPSPNSVNDRFHGCSLQAVSVRHSSGRSDEDEAEDSSKNFFSPYSIDTSDVDSSSISTRHEFNSIVSIGSSPSDSPYSTYKNPKHFVQQEEHETPRFLDNDSYDQEPVAISKNEDNTYDDLLIFEDQLNFEKNDIIWFPPAPDDDENNDEENNFFSYTDNDDEMGEASGVFTEKDKHEEQKKPLRTVVQGHFRALVSQLLQSEMMVVDEWLDIITSLAWEAANFVKPDTSKGGSMDPGDYVKIKCIASGSPNESTFVKGVVCTKNIKHKRMTSQYTNPRLLILGGALEYQRSSNQLASIETLLQQEMDNLKMIVSRIEAHRPNVLLVEKTVSSYAQEYLLAKDISLVLNVKRPLLERISRCTGAPITPSIDKICTTGLGQCELFKLEKISEEHEVVDQFNKKPSKTLMFFEGCPWRLGCTVLLKGSSRDELKKVKHVVQYAIFAAYHLSLETSFLADEGATLPKMTVLPSMTDSERMNASFGSELEGHDATVDHQNTSLMEGRDVNTLSCPLGGNIEASGHAIVDQDERKSTEFDEQKKAEKLEVINAPNEYYSTNDNQSILVSYSSRCVLNETVCERPRLLRIKFYGCFDKPLGRYLQDDLFDKNSSCRSCKEPTEAHVISYTHQHGNLTINVRRIKSLNNDGKIWMWHRCLRCALVDGVPPATRRVVMSDAAWGLSLGKFLELSFSNHATANRVANCGHSLQKDCLRFYGFGSMVAVFRYSPIDILSVHLPPSVLEFNVHVQQAWLKEEASELLTKTEALYEEIIDVLHGIEQKSTSFGTNSSDSNELSNHVMELKDELVKEKQDYVDLLQSPSIDIFELNRLRHSLMIGLHVWDRRLFLLNSLYGLTSNRKLTSDAEVKSWRSDSIDFDSASSQTELSFHSVFEDSRSSSFNEDGGVHEDIEHKTSLERAPSAASVLSEQIDSAWAGVGPVKAPVHHEPSLLRQMNQTELFPSPARVYSFESALKPHEKIKKELTPSLLYLSTLRSFHASGDYIHMVKDYNIPRSYSQAVPSESQPSDSFISKMSFLPEGVRLMLPCGGLNGIVIAVYDNEPTSIIAYALASKEYAEQVDFDFDLQDLQNSPHLTVPFEDESGNGGKVKFSVTCYFAKRFDGLRKKCCPSEVDFVRSMSRCKRWNAQGGKSNVYFAKSMDERFIIKQVTKTEMEAFEEFAPQYFKYLTDSLDSGSPTCLAKIVGIYQVTVKHLRGGKEAKMNVMVMENVFYERNISRIYDLKGSLRSRYNSDTTGTNKTMLDMNLLETLHTKPIFLGSKAKRTLERAVWNDTSFLASIDVMDYSLLVGVDDEKKQLVLGIIDFMRQYTWDKHLETWVKASGILGGPKNASPTIVSPIQYKKRFRKAMTSYFLTVPDQWSS